MKGFDILSTRVFEPGYSSAELEGLNLIMIMGAKGVYDIKEHPWLIKEKELFRIVRICLRTQLIPDILGAKVIKKTKKKLDASRHYLTITIKLSYLEF